MKEAPLRLRQPKELGQGVGDVKAGAGPHGGGGSASAASRSATRFRRRRWAASGQFRQRLSQGWMGGPVSRGGVGGRPWEASGRRFCRRRLRMRSGGGTRPGREERGQPGGQSDGSGAGNPGAGGATPREGSGWPFPSTGGPSRHGGSGRSGSPTYSFLRNSGGSGESNVGRNMPPRGAPSARSPAVSTVQEGVVQGGPQRGLPL